jgi:hypothetical protein
MAETLTIVCDVCGQPAEEEVTIRARGRNVVKDLCRTHMNELLKGTRAPRRGRRGGTTIKASVAKSPAKRRGRPKGSVSKKTASKSPAKNGRRRRKATKGRRRSTRGATTA